MINESGESSQPYDFTSKNMVHEGYEIGMSPYQPTYTYSSKLVMALDQEVRRWKAHAAPLERQLEVVRQENLNLRCQLKQEQEVTYNTRPLQVEVRKILRKQNNGQGLGVIIDKRIRKCRHCGKANHKNKITGG